MILESVVIDNIRSYGHEEILFPRGISLFEGDIGSGKSTILMSVEFALFGLGSQDAESLLAKREDSGSVSLEFSVDGSKYEIRRALTRKGSKVSQDPKNSWIRAGGQKEPLSPADLKRRILQILKFNEPADPRAGSRIFRYAVFTPQEAMKEVLSDKDRRLETIRRAFGIEDYITAVSNARQLQSQLNSRIAVLHERFRDMPELEAQNAELAKRIEEADMEIADLTRREKECKESETRATSELNGLQEKKQEKARADAERRALEDKIKDLKRRVDERRRDLKQYEMDVEEKKSRLNRLAGIKMPDTEQSVSELDVEIAKYEKMSNELIRLGAEQQATAGMVSTLGDSLGDQVNSDAAQLQKTLDGLQDQKSSLEKIGDDLTSRLERASEGQIRRREQKKGLEEEMALLSQLGNACPTCEQEITPEHHHKLVDGRQSRADSLGQEIESGEKEMAKANEESVRIQSRIESCDSDMEKIRSSIPELREYAEKSLKLERIEHDIAKIRREERDKKYGDKPLDHLRRIREQLTRYEDASEQIRQITSDKQEIERRIQENLGLVEYDAKAMSDREAEMEKMHGLDKFDGLDEAIAEKNTLLTSLKNDLANINGLLAAACQKRADAEERIAENDESIAQSERWRKECVRVEECSDWLKLFLIPVIPQIERHVLQSVWQSFNEIYRSWYSILIDDPTKESSIDEDFTPIVSQDGYDQKLDHLSGGEKTSVALAYRLTLNSLMRRETESMRSNLLILDEPTDGFSKNQLGKVRELLDELKSDQIILVSHERELETHVDNVFEVSKQDGVSSVLRRDGPP